VVRILIHIPKEDVMPISLAGLGIDEAAEALGREIDIQVGYAKWLKHVESFGYSRNDVWLVNGIN
jgi:hypothetical protein